MTVQRAVHLLAGTMVLASLSLGYFVSPKWYLLSVFVGVNLIQSAFTNWCLAMTVFRALGLKDSASASCR